MKEDTLNSLIDRNIFLKRQLNEVRSTAAELYLNILDSPGQNLEAEERYKWALNQWERVKNELLLVNDFMGD